MKTNTLGLSTQESDTVGHEPPELKNIVCDTYIVPPNNFKASILLTGKKLEH